MRSIDDIVVPGAIGKYGLKVTRYFNSRRAKGDGWGFEYLWYWDYIQGKIFYPNGTVWDNSCTGAWGLPGPLGVSDGWVPNYTGTKFRLSDGGTVIFNSSGLATQIIDPYNQTINITYATDWTWVNVTEPGGRYLHFTISGGVTSRVDAYDGQGHLIDYVIYNYSPIKPNGNQGVPINCLTLVDYSDVHAHAYYAYGDDNAPDHPPPLHCPCSSKIYPVLRTCRDVRYAGAMRNICYEYQDQGPHGAIIAERYSLNGTTNGVQVSKIDPPAPSPIVTDPNFETTYTETRGDGNVARTFTYTPLHITRFEGDTTCGTWIPREDNPAPQQFLQNYTDFQGHLTYLDYDVNWYVNWVKDARGNITTYTRGPAPPLGIGQITDVTYPERHRYRPLRLSARVWKHTRALFDVRNDSRPTPLLAEITVHTRDTNHRVTQTDYKEGTTLLARETFTYCDQVDSQCGIAAGQLKTQKLKNGSYVHYSYDSRGLLIDKWEPTWTTTRIVPNRRRTMTYYTTDVSTM